MNLLFFILSFALGGLLIAVVCSYIQLRNMIQRRYEIIDVLKREGFFQQIQREFEFLADEKLDHLVLNFKEKVPMVGVFLIGDLEVTLKELAKQELLSMIPEIEKSVFDNLQKRDFFCSPRGLFSFFIRISLPTLFVGGILGAIFGCIFYFLRPN